MTELLSNDTSRCLDLVICWHCCPHNDRVDHLLKIAPVKMRILRRNAVASLRLSGFFAVANAWVAAHARRPLILLGAVVAISGVFSAFLVNDAICLVLTPLVLELTLALGRRPVPYLLAIAMASNVGSTATITGNPQNIMIGSFSNIPYTKFALALGPVALVGLIVTVTLIALFHRGEFAGTARLEARPPKVDANRVLVIRALLATLILIALFFAGLGRPRPRSSSAACCC
jgi:Na+/H+ antiporter NhaD/arsenite permease-like protein